MKKEPARHYHILEEHEHMTQHAEKFQYWEREVLRLTGLDEGFLPDPLSPEITRTIHISLKLLTTILKPPKTQLLYYHLTENNPVKKGGCLFVLIPLIHVAQFAAVARNIDEVMITLIELKMINYAHLREHATY